ncbi:MAG: signal recognition particle receptor subunit alpha [Magnetococcus sp. YQC-3]
MSWFERLKTGLSKTRERFSKGFDDLLTGRKINEELFDDLEGLLITSDFGLETSVAIIEEVRKRHSREMIKQPDALRQLLRQIVLEWLRPAQVDATLFPEKPGVVLVVGVNGVGKTTTIGKLAHYYRGLGRSVMLAAGDTFRAAAVEQLRLWGKRCDCPVVAQQHGADSASVIFDAWVLQTLTDKSGIVVTLLSLKEGDNLWGIPCVCQPFGDGGPIVGMDLPGKPMAGKKQTQQPFGIAGMALAKPSHGTGKATTMPLDVVGGQIFGDGHGWR